MIRGLLHLLLTLLITTSCSLVKKKELDKKEDMYSKPAVLQLVFTTYVKGCIEGINSKKPEKTYGVNLNICQDLGKEHTKGISQLLK